MTDNDIKKALECCANWESDKSCEDCPANTYGFGCANKMAKYSLDLINRLQEQIKKLENIERFATKTIEKQEAEIERLKEKIESKILIQIEANSRYEEKKLSLLKDIQSRVKSEVIKEFAEKVNTELDKRVSEKIRERNPHWYIAKRIVRETAIEMTEVSK